MPSSSLLVGSYSLTATYSGDDFSTSSTSASVALTVNPVSGYAGLGASTSSQFSGSSQAPSLVPAFSPTQSSYSISLAPSANISSFTLDFTCVAPCSSSVVITDPAGAVVSVPLSAGVNMVPVGSIVPSAPISVELVSAASAGVLNITLAITQQPASLLWSANQTAYNSAKQSVNQLLSSAASNAASLAALPNALVTLISSNPAGDTAANNATALLLQSALAAGALTSSQSSTLQSSLADQSTFDNAVAAALTDTTGVFFAAMIQAIPTSGNTADIEAALAILAKATAADLISPSSQSTLVSGLVAEVSPVLFPSGCTLAAPLNGALILSRLPSCRYLMQYSV